MHADVDVVVDSDEGTFIETNMAMDVEMDG